jgi:hypothetical protein
MKKYTPKDALPLPPPLAGKGLFARLLLPDDGDKRKAAIYGVALEAAANALEWIRYRLVNGLEGGVYDGPLSFTNVQTLGSHNPKIHVTSGLDVDGGLDVTGKAHVKGRLDVDGDIAGAQDVSGLEAFFQTGHFQDITASQTTTTKSLQFSGIVGATMHGSVTDTTLKTRTGKTIRQGVFAYETLRRATADVSKSNTVDPTTFDLLVIPGPGVPAGVVLTLAAPPGNATLNPFWIVRRHVGSNPNDVMIHGASGARIVTLTKGTDKTGICGFLWDGVDYVPFGPQGSVTVP